MVLAVDETAALEIRGLRKQYDNGTLALDGVDLTVEQGDFFALLGPNGAGKSTTIGVICSLVNKSAGQVKIHNVDIDENFPLAKQYLGVVPQEFNFNQFEKVFDIVVTQAGYYGVPLEVAKERAEYYLKKLGLWEKRDDRSRLLSGGMKRRLMIARALVHDPKLLILDEPTAGVDIELRRSMWDFLIELNEQGTTIILTTHYLEEAESLCRNIAIIDRGKIIEQGDLKSLVAKLDKQSFLLDVDQVPTDLSACGTEQISLSVLDEKTLQLDVAQGAPLNEVFLALNQQGIQVLSMKNKTNRLEEMFVLLTQGSSTAQDQGTTL